MAERITRQLIRPDDNTPQTLYETLNGGQEIIDPQKTRTRFPLTKAGLVRELIREVDTKVGLPIISPGRLNGRSLREVTEWAATLANNELKSAILTEQARISDDAEDQWPLPTPRHPNRFSLAMP